MNNQDQDNDMNDPDEDSIDVKGIGGSDDRAIDIDDLGDTGIDNDSDSIEKIKAALPTNEEIEAIACTWKNEGSAHVFLLTVPGKIVFVGADSTGEVRAVNSKHDIPHLRTIKLVDSAVEDHSMNKYAMALRQANGSKGRRALPKRQFATAVAVDVDVERKGKGEEKREGEGDFVVNVPCQICLEDPTWCYLSKSVTSRAAATQNCTNCGLIVCVVCAPAGKCIFSIYSILLFSI